MPGDKAAANKVAKPGKTPPAALSVAEPGMTLLQGASPSHPTPIHHLAANSSLA